jgi:rod shape-determining protein MreD
MLPGWELLLAPVFEALLWPPATWLLLAPQRRAPDPDENRPL